MIPLCMKVVDIMKDDYPEFGNRIADVCRIVKKECSVVEDLIKKSVREFKSVSEEMDKDGLKVMDGKKAYHLFMSGLGSKSFLNKLAARRGYLIDWQEFEINFEEHKRRSAIGLAKRKEMNEK